MLRVSVFRVLRVSVFWVVFRDEREDEREDEAPGGSARKTRRSSRLRSYTLGSADAWETDRITPNIKRDAISEEPPDEMKGSGLPVVGRRPTTQPMFKNAWNTTMAVRPPATMELK